MRRGFSMVELVIVLSILLALLPIVFQLARRVEEAHALATWHLATADAIGGVAEELRLDSRRGAPVRGPVAWNRCGVRYEVREEVLVRVDTCTGDRALARHVEAVRWARGGVEVTFVRRLRPGSEVRTTVLVPVEAP